MIIRYPLIYTDELRRVAELNVLGLGSADLPSWDMVTHYHKVTEKVRLIFNRIFLSRMIKSKF